MQSFSSRNDQIKETASGTAYVYLCMLMCTALIRAGITYIKMDNFNSDVLATDRPLGVFLILWYIKNGEIQ